MQSGEDPVLVRLEVAAEGAHLVAKLVFTSRSPEPIYLERAKTQPGQRLDYNLFYIFDGGDRITFTGTLAKRPPPGPEEFVLLPPSGTLEARVRLDQAYDFPRGTRDYEIYYQAVNSSRGEQPLFKLVSNRVAVEYHR